MGRERAEVAEKACFLGGLLEEPYDEEGEVSWWSRQSTLYVRSP